MNRRDYDSKRCDIPSNYGDLALLISQAEKKWPDRCAVDFLKKRMTYRQLYLKSRCFAALLHQLGFSKGERIALIMPNCLYYPICCYGALMAGVVIVNISPLSSGEQIKKMLEKTQCKALVSVDVKVIFDKIEQLIKDKALQYFIIGNLLSNLPLGKRILAKILRKSDFSKLPLHKKNVISLDTMLAKKIYFDENNVQHNPCDVVLMQFTGGTTGTPKAAVLTNQNIAANIEQVLQQKFDLKEGKEVFLGALPFFHIFSMTVNLLLPLRLGATVVLLPNMEPKSVVKACKRTQCTVFPGVPSLFAALNLIPKKTMPALKKVRYCVSGGAPLEKHTWQRFYRNFNIQIYEGYGLTEASPVVAFNPLNVLPKQGSIGKALADTKTRIVSLEDGETVVERGELTVCGPQVMQGYWQEEQETKQVLRNGWLYTGDIATEDEDGYLRIVGRVKDMILTGGHNVYSAVVEEVIYQFGNVEEVLVVGVKDRLRGQSVHAYIFCGDANRLVEAELRCFLHERLADYEVPRKIIFSEHKLPRTAVGKLSRQLLLEKISTASA